ncbi:hypothetical protein PVMG_03080 [Plasmodium vivax Mauritania I]|uniref:DNA repair protein REV1 n=1 Tax=Plasmodium vivax Mauritania I TaxID=1035515 RepID=A0A0J9W1F9_PLAVI|nr:hypothetical protein PVMG_03080 [Plasmodium vivax Mauritania I]
MDVEYGGSRSFSRYMWRKEEKIPLSYNKKYGAEIEQAEGKDKKDSREDSRSTRPLFSNCNFYIDDFVSLFSLYNSCDKGHKGEGEEGVEEGVEEEGEEEGEEKEKEEEAEATAARESPSQRTALHRGEVSPHDEWNSFTNHAEERTVDRYYNSFNSQAKCSTPYNDCNLGGENNYVNFFGSDFERAELTKLQDRPIQDADMSLDRTPAKSNHYGLVETLEDKHTSRERNQFDTFMRSYERVHTNKRNVHASYINKKEQIEIMIIQNGGVIHNALTSKVTHIISNNMALGSKKYMDYKKAIKKSKVFIVADKYIFDCVKFQCRFPEQSYLPSLLRYNSRQITEFFPFKERSRRRRRAGGEVNTTGGGTPSIDASIARGETPSIDASIARGETPSIDASIARGETPSVGASITRGDTPSVGASNTLAQNCAPAWAHHEEGGDPLLGDSPEKSPMGDDSPPGKRLTDGTPIDKHLLMLNMQMSYANVKKYIVCNSAEYFKRLRLIYLKKELKENAFPNVGPNLHINRNTFEDFSRKHRILSHLTEQEINWVKKKSQLNIKVKNVWENDIIHFFFDIVLRTKGQPEGGSAAVSGGGSAGGSEGGHNRLSSGNASEKLIESVSAYLHNSRLYILGNWNYISREFFKFEDINEGDKRKCVYLYIDFDNYFLNASVKGASEPYGKSKKIDNHEILCVCHSLKKEESYGIISATNYWGKKNKILKGMVKGEVTKMHRDNIRFVKYDFSNILRCSYLFLLVLINYSKNVRVLSVDESILQLFYETEEEIFSAAKQIAEDIYTLTNLSVSIGISSNLSMSRKALKFCKKRFLFFDYYHHFCIFIMGKYFLTGGTKGEINRGEHVHSGTPQRSFQKERAPEECNLHDVRGDQKGAVRTEQGDTPVREENRAAGGHRLQNAPLSSEELEGLFDEYVAAGGSINSTSNNTTSNCATSNYATSNCATPNCATSNYATSTPSDAYFLNAMKGKRDPRVDSLFNKFVQANRAHLEHMTNNFFDRVIHPVSRFFFFYNKNEHYLDVLRQLNYLNGQFVHFNIYHLPVDERAPALPCDDLPEAILKKLKKKDSDRIEGKKSINISVNYGVRFEYINDFYFLIYFMTKQLYIRLRIKKLKAKCLHVHFFLKEENENVNPVKYLGRGKVFRVSSRIKLSHYTDNFFVYFFKVIYSFDALASSLSDLRGVQMVCSDVVSTDALHALGRRSILFYFPLGGRESMKAEQEINMNAAQEVKLEAEQEVNMEAEQEVNMEAAKEVNMDAAKEAKTVAPNMRDAQVHPAWGKNGKEAAKRATHAPRHHRRNRGGNSKPRKPLPLIDGRHAKSILCYFFNTKKEAEDEKKVDMSSDKCIPFSFKSGAKKKKKKYNNYGGVRRATTPLPPSNCNMPKKIKITRNYKIFDFFPSILVKRKRQSSSAAEQNDHVDKLIDGNGLTTDKNIFDSIINKRVKKEAQIKEEFNCCYVSYRNILEHVMEKLKGLTTLREGQHVCANESANDAIFCHSYVIRSLYEMNRESERGVLYTYTKGIISSYISHYNNLFQKHDCRNDAADRYYLLKFVAAVVDSLCEELHRRRLLDVLHKFLKNFKHVWCFSCAEEAGEEKEERKESEKGEKGEKSKKSSFPPLFHRTMVKYGVY